MRVRGSIRVAQHFRTAMQKHLETIEFARFRRQTSDEHERLMWQMLRGRQRRGMKQRAATPHPQPLARKGRGERASIEQPSEAQG